MSSSTALSGTFSDIMNIKKKSIQKTISDSIPGRCVGP
jgi:hypothetical protein